MMDVKLYTGEQILQTSSNGNQEKWYNKEDNRWYKLDQFGYEGLAEVVTSRMLEKSNICDSPFSFTSYRMERVTVRGISRVGCSSKNFLSDDEELITVAHLLKQYTGKSLDRILNPLSSNKQRLIYLCEKIAELTELELFPQYLTLLFEVDRLCKNNDRHLNNIAVISRGDKYDYCPIFDNGAGFMSNVSYFPVDVEPMALAHTVKARPLGTTFNRQVNTAQALYGEQLRISKFDKNDIIEFLDDIFEYYPNYSRGLLLDRVLATINDK